MASEDSDFPRVFRGYDPEAVDRTILRMRKELLAAKTEADRLTIVASELTEKNEALEFAVEQAGAPSYAAFGHVFESTLRQAEELAETLRNRAQAEALNIKNSTERERTQLVENARTESSELLALAQARADEIIRLATDEAALIISEAQVSAQTLTEAAQAEVSLARRSSTTELTRDKSQAKREVEKLQSAAEREIAELRLVLTKNAHDTDLPNINERILEILRIDADAAAHRDEAETEYLTKHNEAVHTTELYLEQSRAELAALNEHIATARATSQALIEQAKAQSLALSKAVDARALSLLSEAGKSAEATAQHADELAREIVQRAETQARDLISAVTSEREAFAALLSTMRSEIPSGTVSGTQKRARAPRSKATSPSKSQ